jgi:hypothetical protein
MVRKGGCMDKWEYRMVVLDLSFNALEGPGSIAQNESELNLYGRDGWEVVSVIPHVASKKPQATVILKRPHRDPIRKIVREEEKSIPGL